MLTEKTGTITAQKVTLRGKTLTVSDVASAAKLNSRVEITSDSAVAVRIAKSVKAIAQAVDNNQVVYGVTTGFGSMADETVPCEVAAASQTNLLAFLAAGAGPAIDPRHTRAAMMLRANVLLRGCSGIRLEVIERLIQFLNADAIPVVRELGSIGASGDLVPLASIARAITGKFGYSQVLLNGEKVNGRKALNRLNLDPIELLPKEGLALVNGTSFSAAIAANAVYETRSLMGLAVAAQSMMLRSLMVQDAPFESFVHECKPHPGQIWTAQTIKQLLAGSDVIPNGKPIPVQDRYSLRCLPQYMGPIVEGVARVENTVAIEMNGISDNPLIDPATGRFHQSGNFLGQYVGVAMDDLRRFIGLMAKHLDVQIALLVTPEFSNGLTSSLRGNDQVPYFMGLKGLQISGNSIMPMLTYLGNPLVEHSPTHAEQFNQNVNGLSWGAANLAWKSVEMFQHYMAISLLFAVQAVDMRAKSSFGHYDGRVILGAVGKQLYSAVCNLLEHSPGKDRPFLYNDSDRWLEEDIESLKANISQHGEIIESIRPIVASFEESF